MNICPQEENAKSSNTPYLVVFKPYPIFAKPEVPGLIETPKEEIATQIYLQKQWNNACLAGATFVLLIHQDNIPTCEGNMRAQLFMGALAQLQRLFHLRNLFANQIQACVWMRSLGFAPRCKPFTQKHV